MIGAVNSKIKSSKVVKKEEVLALLRSSHNLSVIIRLLTLDHNHIPSNLTKAFYDGSITIDVDAEVTRAADLKFFDPEERIKLDPDSPSRTSVFITNMIQVIVVISDPERTKEFSIPVFTGPIDAVSRDGVFLDVKCLGKESLSLDNTWKARTFGKNQRKTDIIRTILRTLCGETKFSIANSPKRAPNQTKLNSEAIPWKVAKRLASTIGMQLFYDGRGVATLRRTSKNPVWTLNDDWVTDSAGEAYDLTEFYNAVRVTGGKPKKGKKAIKYTAVAPRNHPLSPWRLGRGGVPRYVWGEDLEDDSIRSLKEAKREGKRILARGLMAEKSIAVDGLPNYLIQEQDVIKVNTDGVFTTIGLRQATLPLTAENTASYGYLRRMKPRGGARPIKVRSRGSKGKGRKKKNRGKSPGKGKD